MFSILMTTVLNVSGGSRISRGMGMGGVGVGGEATLYYLFSSGPLSQK